MTNEERIKQLEREVAELKEWIRKRDEQIIQVPFDDVSKNILAQFFTLI